jgi:hypothetical protein
MTMMPHRSDREYRVVYTRRKRKEDPFRLRSFSYLYFIRGKPCLQCGSPGEAHHIQYAQPRALGRKTGDQYAVPLCHPCHMKLHNDGIPERTWWALRGIDPVKWAERSYEEWSKEHGVHNDDTGS